MRERLWNALRGYGLIMNAERDRRITQADENMPMVVGRIVSQWGVSKYWRKEGKP